MYLILENHMKIIVTLKHKKIMVSIILINVKPFYTQIMDYSSVEYSSEVILDQTTADKINLELLHEMELKGKTIPAGNIKLQSSIGQGWMSVYIYIYDN